MTRSADEFDIIGSKPRPKSIEEQVRGLGLFDEAMRESLEAADSSRAPTPTVDPRVRPEHVDGPARIREPKRATPQELPLSEREKDRLAAVERIKGLVLAPLLELAEKRKDRDEAPGVTADDVYLIAQRFPQVVLLGQEQRAFSWTGPWLAELAAAGALAPFTMNGVPVLRRSTQRGRNRQQVYLHPDNRRA